MSAMPRPPGNVPRSGWSYRAFGVGEQALATSPGPSATFGALGPVGEVAAGGLGVRVPGAEHPLLDSQQGGVLVAGPGRLPRLPGPPGQAVAVPQGVRVLGAPRPLLDSQQEGVLVAGPGRLPRLP